MRKAYTVTLLTLAIAITAMAGSKIEGTGTLKDFQPAGFTSSMAGTRSPLRRAIFMMPRMTGCSSQALRGPTGRPQRPT